MGRGSPLVDMDDKDKGIYPLTMVVSVIARLDASKDTRQAAASFLDFSRIRGQQPGTGVGDLPAGHLPMPASLRAQNAAAADALRKGVDPDKTDDPGPGGGSEDPGGPTSGPGTITASGESVGAAANEAVKQAETVDGDTTTPTAYSSAQPWTSSVIVPIALALGLVALVLGGVTSWLVRQGRGPAWLRR
jgi:hypothetical protein